MSPIIKKQKPAFTFYYVFNTIETTSLEYLIHKKNL